MRLLIDSQSLIWYVDEDHLLALPLMPASRTRTTTCCSVRRRSGRSLSRLELKKLSLSMPYKQWITKAMADLDMIVLPITVEYADVQAGLPNHHQTRSTECWWRSHKWRISHLVSADPVFDQYQPVLVKACDAMSLRYDTTHLFRSLPGRPLEKVRTSATRRFSL